MLLGGDSRAADVLLEVVVQYLVGIQFGAVAWQQDYADLVVVLDEPLPKKVFDKGS